MARLVLLFVVVVALTAGAVSMGGAAAAPHRGPGVASGVASFPSWSPNGKQILFGYLGSKGNRIVRTSSTPGGAIRTIHVGRNDYPVLWAPGGHIVFGRIEGVNWYSVGVRGGKAKRISLPSCGSGAGCWPDSCLSCSPDTFAILSPNHRYAAVTTDTGAGNPPPPESIALLKLRPGHEPVEIPTPLNAEEQGGAVSDSILSFSPHGRQLIFRRSGLMALRLGGGPPVPLAQSGLPGAALVPRDAQRVQWSPDGRWIAFLENQNLEVVPANGGSAPRVLPPCSTPGDFLRGFSWSPTSKLIAYDCLSNVALPPDGSELMTVRPDGTRLTNVLEHHRWLYVNDLSGLPEPAQWSPDGSHLLFLAAQAYGAGTSIFTIRPNGHRLTRLG